MDMEKDFTIRKATPSDLDIILHYRRQMFIEMGYTDDGKMETSMHTAREYFRDVLAEDRYKGWFVQESNGKIVRRRQHCHLHASKSSIASRLASCRHPEHVHRAGFPPTGHRPPAHGCDDMLVPTGKASTGSPCMPARMEEGSTSRSDLNLRRE